MTAVDSPLTPSSHPRAGRAPGPHDGVVADAVRAALGTVMDPELDEPITDLGFVSEQRIDEVGDGRVDVEVHLRLPTSFCAPNFAYLMAADAQDALGRIDAVREIAIFLDDHHDSTKINSGLAAGGGYRGTFAHEADDSLDELRMIFRRKAHTAAMERSCSALIRAGARTVEDLHSLRVGDLPKDASTDALLRRRLDLGFSNAPEALVMVDDRGAPIPEDQVPLRLRFARTTRISIDGNAHFCRGLLRTRYPGSGDDQTARADDPDLTLRDSHPTTPESER
ncbi:iron-sulfur cluster assembly protein [Microlunatus flavus]|uniref:Metal-sulfur cluster biosynthetic enzyme n=1 Tax=Microlunatus flavus TaxID=1036181 RepID=A0A1H9HCI4_9ACTN|nr:iron-sulfur cluster assembly protein [Microlunatus flavus]SEQ60003.1 Metal-sulfur cluster biosynthetic enzyme [Microlunatus flavus]